jgi:hypothetical protein
MEMALSNAERQRQARERYKGERDLQRLSQWISKSAYVALGHIALFRGLTRSRVLEELILREADDIQKKTTR